MRLSKVQIAVPSAIVLLAALAGGAQLWGQHEAHVRIDQTLASLPPGTQGHYDDLSYNVFTRTLRLSGLSVTQSGHPFLSIHRIVLHHLSGQGTDQNPLQADSVHVTGLDAWRQGRRVSVGFAVVTKLAMLAPGQPAPPTTPLWMQIPGQATLLSAGSIEAQDISDDAGDSIAAISATGYDQGKLAAASGRDFANRAGDRVASVAVQQVDLDGLDRVFDTGRYTADAPSWTGLRPLIGHAEISGFTSKSNSGNGAVMHAAVDNFAARPFALSPTGKNTQTDAFRRDAAQAVSLGSASITGFTFSDPRTKSQGGLGQFSVTGYQAGKLANVTLSDWSMTDPDMAEVHVGEFQVSNFDASGFLTGDTPLDTADWIIAAQKGAVTLGGMSVTKVSVKLPDGNTVSLGALKETISAGNPLDAKISLQSLSVPAAISAYLQEVLDPLGIKTLVLNLEESGSFNRTTGDSTLDHFLLRAEGLASLSITGQFGSVPLSLPTQNDPAAVFALIGKMTIGHAAITFTNDSLVQKILAMMAKQSNQSLADVTSGARVAMSFFASAVVPDQPDAGQVVGAFMADPKSLTLTATPDKPVAVGGLLGSDLNATQAALNLKLSAN
ncbi:hypothetical protein [Acidisoma sp. 7E03]